MKGSRWLNSLTGWLSPDAYSTAWVAMVPDLSHPDRPAWPGALDFLRSRQLDDGGWGEPHILFAHERTVSTLAAIQALSLWKDHPRDEWRIRRGLAALRNYAPRLIAEPHQPVGFEMLLPRLRDALKGRFGPELPLSEWSRIDLLGEKKLVMLQALQPDPAAQSAWWVSMEILPEERLAGLDDKLLLDRNGSIATSTAATAAYLRAKRLRGDDSSRAACYLDKVMALGGGSVPFCWPVEMLEQVWALDNFMRVDINPQSQSLKSVVENIYRAWNHNEAGLSYSDAFPVNDGDDTLLGYMILQWSGRSVDEEPMLGFWNHSHFRGYLDERGASPSVNIHALSVLRAQHGFPNQKLACQVSDWLMTQLRPDTVFDDKWHLSPFYSVSHAIPAFAGWDDSIARRCINFLRDQQRPDGGWGSFGYSTLEETAHCVIGLYQAHKSGLLSSMEPLSRAWHFLISNAGQQALESMWIGKTLYRPEGIVKAVLFAARSALKRVGIDGMMIEEGKRIA